MSTITLHVKTPKGGEKHLIPIQIASNSTVAQLKKTLVDTIEDFKEHAPNDVYPFSPDSVRGR